MEVKSEDDATIVDKIIELVTEFPQGVSDKVLIANMPTVDPKARAMMINKLLMAEKIDLFNGKDGLLYRKREPSKAGSIAGDQEEKVVFKIIEGAGNVGVWIRDIRAKSNLGQTQLTKVLKSLEMKNLIKSVKSVNASNSKKKVYMLFNLQPDQSVTGGAWYGPDNNFESEFVEVMNQQCYRMLYQKLESAQAQHSNPMAVKTASMVTVGEVVKCVSDLGISKVSLNEAEIEKILKTVVYDGKAEKCESLDGKTLYRAVKPLFPSAGISRCPCGVCPLIKKCGDVGDVTPLKCHYFKDWLEEF